MVLCTGSTCFLMNYAHRFSVADLSKYSQYNICHQGFLKYIHNTLYLFYLFRYALSAFGGTPPEAVARRAPSTTRTPLLIRKNTLALLNIIFKLNMR